jgi:hypothetical protein
MGVGLLMSAVSFGRHYEALYNGAGVEQTLSVFIGTDFCVEALSPGDYVRKRVLIARRSSIAAYPSATFSRGIWLEPLVAHGGSLKTVPAPSSSRRLIRPTKTPQSVRQPP